MRHTAFLALTPIRGWDRSWLRGASLCRELPLRTCPHRAEGSARIARRATAYTHTLAHRRASPLARMPRIQPRISSGLMPSGGISNVYSLICESGPLVVHQNSLSLYL